MDNEHWQEEFLSQLGEGPSTMQPSADNTDNPEDSDVEETLELPPLKITRYDEALSSLEDVSAFLQSKGQMSEADQIMAFSSKVTALHCQSLANNSRQTSLMEFFDL